MEMLVHDRSEGRPNARHAARGAAGRRRTSTAAYYETRAEEYAAATMALDVSERIARFAGSLAPGAKVLDAGCGAGRDLVGLKASGLDPIGLDCAAPLVEIARRTSGLPVVVGDLRDPPFPPSSFDGVWAMASLLHLERAETTAALRSLTDLLVPGGILFASVKRGTGQACDEDGRWFTLHDELGWEGHLRDAGLQIIEIIGEPPAHAIGSVSPGWISSLARLPA
ncbi:SAM-dependent methyltransferase [Sphingomonas sp. UYAg733]